MQNSVINIKTEREREHDDDPYITIKILTRVFPLKYFELQNFCNYASIVIYKLYSREQT